MKKIFLSLAVLLSASMARATGITYSNSSSAGGSSITANNFTASVSTFGEIMLGIGSAGAPSLTFMGSPGGASRRTGFYANTNNEIRLAANGTQVFAISGAAINGANGTISAPFYAFSSASGYGMSLDAVSNSALYFSQNGSLRVRMDVSGTLIGTNKPSRASLHVSSGPITNAPILVVDSDVVHLEMTGSSTTLGGANVFVTSPVFITNLSSGGYVDSAVNSQLLITTSSINTTYEFKVTTTSHLSVSGASVTVTACGTAPLVSGSDTAFTVTPGGGAPGSCAVSFGVPYRVAPVCVAQERTGSVTNTFSYAVTNIGITATETAIGPFDVICFGNRE